MSDVAPVVASNGSLAARLRGFGPVGIAAILVVLAGALVAPLISAVLVLIWARWSRTPWADLGLARPKSWALDLAIGIAFGCAFKLLMKSVVMPLLGAPPVNQAFHYLAGNRAAIPETLFMFVVGAGLSEEIFFRGYLFERLRKLLGSGTGAMVSIILLTTILFGLAHYPGQSVPGVQQATIVGLVFACLFARTRSLWMLIFAHAAFDLTAYALIYWELETRVARFFMG